MDEARRFYSGPWRQSIVERYGLEPDIEYFDVFALTDVSAGSVTELPARPASI